MPPPGGIFTIGPFTINGHLAEPRGGTGQKIGSGSGRGVWGVRKRKRKKKSSRFHHFRILVVHLAHRMISLTVKHRRGRGEGPKISISPRWCSRNITKMTYLNDQGVKTPLRSNAPCERTIAPVKKNMYKSMLKFPLWVDILYLAKFQFKKQLGGVVLRTCWVRFSSITFLLLYLG